MPPSLLEEGRDPGLLRRLLYKYKQQGGIVLKLSSFYLLDVFGYRVMRSFGLVQQLRLINSKCITSVIKRPVRKVTFAPLFVAREPL